MSGFQKLDVSERKKSISGKFWSAFVGWIYECLAVGHEVEYSGLGCESVLLCKWFPLFWTNITITPTSNAVWCPRRPESSITLLWKLESCNNRVIMYSVLLYESFLLYSHSLHTVGVQLAYISQMITLNLGCGLGIQNGFWGFPFSAGTCHSRVKWYIHYLFPDNTIIGKSPFACSWMGNTRYYSKIPWRFMQIVGGVKNQTTTSSRTSCLKAPATSGVSCVCGITA